MRNSGPESDFTADQQHASTLAVLAEVRDYLLRLPPHRLTADMIGKVDAHLAQPTARLLSKSEQVCKGTVLASNGVPLAEALQRGNVVAVRIPYLNQADAMPRNFFGQVSTGFLIDVAPAGRSQETLTCESFSDWMPKEHPPLSSSSNERGPASPESPFDHFD